MPIRWKIITNNRNSIFTEGELSRKYLKDSVVSADPRTMGLMTFETEENARHFHQALSFPKSRHSFITKVQGIGRGKRPKQVSLHQWTKYLLNWYLAKESFGCLPPPGTICYKKVKVLE